MSWERVNLGDVALVDWGNTNLTKTSYVENGSYIAVSAAGMDGRINHFEHNEETIVISAIGANCGVVFFPGEKFTAIKNTITVTPNSSLVFGKYLYWFFCTNVFRRRGAGQPFLSKADTELVEIPLPPLYIQKQIAEILDAADALKRKDQELLKKYDELTQAIFIDMFGDPVKNEKGWEVKSLKNLIYEVKNGITRRRKVTENSGEIVLRLRDIRKNKIDFSDVNRIQLFENEKKSFKIDHGDLLFIRVNGNPDYVGRCAVFREINEEVFFNDHIMRVRFNPEVNSTFLAYFLNSEFGKNQIQLYIKTSAGQHTINQSGLEKIKIYFPKFLVQKQFADCFDIIEKQKEFILNSFTENLFKTLIQKAFKGELIV